MVCLLMKNCVLSLPFWPCCDDVLSQVSCTYTQICCMYWFVLNNMHDRSPLMSSLCITSVWDLDPVGQKKHVHFYWVMWTVTFLCISTLVLFAHTAARETVYLDCSECSGQGKRLDRHWTAAHRKGKTTSERLIDLWAFFFSFLLDFKKNFRGRKTRK